MYPDALSNLRSDRTGVLGAVIWVSCGWLPGEGNAPRILVSLGERLHVDVTRDAPSVTIEPTPRIEGHLPEHVATKAIQFVVANEEALLRHWIGELSSSECLELLRSV